MMNYSSALLRIVERETEEKENSIILVIPIAKKNHLFHQQYQAENQTDKQM